jgi:hypothetical protein
LTVSVLASGPRRGPKGLTPLAEISRVAGLGKETTNAVRVALVYSDAALVVIGMMRGSRLRCRHLAQGSTVISPGHRAGILA